MRHYLVMCLEVSKYGVEVTVLGVKHSLERAKEIFDKELPSIKEYAKDMNYTCVDESSPCYYTAGIDEFDAQGSIALYIEAEYDEEEE